MRYLIGFIILILHLLVELRRNDMGNDFMCGADILVSQLETFSFLWGVIIPVILSHQQITKYTFKYQHVIRVNSWKTILISQIRKITLVSVLISMVYIMFVILYCKWNGVVLYNWDAYDSLFYIYTQKQLGVSGSIVYVYAFICIFLRCVVINHILLLFLWAFNREILGILMIFCLMFAEAILGLKWICRLFVFDYHIWCENDERFLMVVQFVVYVVVAMMVYRYLLLRKKKALCE